MIRNKQKSGANLRLISRRKAEKEKRIFAAALTNEDNLDRTAIRKQLQRYFAGDVEEDKKPTQYATLISLLVLFIAFYIVWPSFLEHIDISKKDDEIYVPAGGYSAAPPPTPKQEVKKELLEEMIPQLYPEIKDVTLVIDQEQEEITEDWENLQVTGDVATIEFGLGGSGGGPVYDAGAGGDVPEPELIHRVEPEYPEPARRARVDGFVLMQAIVNKKGDVVDIKILQTPPARYGFAEKARKAVSQWKFKPSIYKGKPVSVRIRFSVEFNLVY